MFFFNLTLFDIGDDLRLNPFKKREDDEDQPNTNVNYTLEVPIESIT
jgi:predicted carbohydrate-binding protein with CBM5 and CBM33 domain